MRLHLVSPTHYLPDGALHKTTRYWTSGITLPYLKALTPAPHRVEFTDELMTGLDLARDLPRRALARPPQPARHRPVVAAAAQGRRLSVQLALQAVLLLADPLFP